MVLGSASVYSPDQPPAAAAADSAGVQQAAGGGPMTRAGESPIAQLASCSNAERHCRRGVLDPD